MPRSIKILLAVIVIPLVLIAGLLFTIPYFVNVDAFGSRIVAEIQKTVGRKVTVGAIHLSLMPPSVVVEKVAVGEDPKFGTGDFATVDKLKVHVGLMALLNRTLDVSSVTADQPSIRLIKNARGGWNIDSLSGGSATSKDVPAKPPRSAPAVEIGRLELTDGTVAIDDLSPPKAPQKKFKHENETFKNLKKRNPFDSLISMRAGKGSTETPETAGPLQQGDPPMLPVKAKVKIEKADLGRLAGPDLRGL